MTVTLIAVAQYGCGAMSLERLRTPDYVAGLFGLLLFCSLFSPWYELVDGTVDAWRSFAITDIYLLLVALLAMAIPVVTAARDSPALPVAMDVLTTWAAAIGIIVVLYRLLAVPNADVVTGRGWGLFAAAACIAGTLAGSYWAMRRQDAPGLRPPPEVRAMPAPPARDPADPPT